MPGKLDYLKILTCQRNGIVLGLAGGEFQNTRQLRVRTGAPTALNSSFSSDNTVASRGLYVRVKLLSNTTVEGLAMCRMYLIMAKQCISTVKL